MRFPPLDSLLAVLLDLPVIGATANYTILWLRRNLLFAIAEEMARKANPAW
jgi:hypothetical protein